MRLGSGVIRRLKVLNRGLDERYNRLLASDEEGASLDALGFSLASDIVELVVLTGDEAFLQTMREAVGGARRLWHVLSPDKVSDLLIAGDVGILVLDVLALHEAPSAFITQIKQQFPDLVVVAAGNRDCESALAGLISKGLVYRFIHKPMSPGRARLFAEAAVKKYEETRKLTATAPSITPPSRSNGWMWGAAIGVLGLVSIIFWAMHKNAAGNAVPPPAAAERPVPAAQLQRPAEPSPSARAFESVSYRAENP